jgi:cytochrome P450
MGSVMDFKEHPAHFIRYAHEAYGDVVSFRMGPSRWVVLGHPADIWDAMVTKADHYQKPALAKRLWDKFLGDSLLTTEGDVWKRLHRMIKPAFHRKRIEAYAETMTAYTHRMIDRWESGPIDIDDEMVGLTLEIVAKTLFDADVRDGAETVGNAMKVLQREMLAHIHMPVPVPAWWPSDRNKRKLQAVEDIEAIVRDVIAERRETGVDRGDLLSTLVFAEEDGDRLSDRELRDAAMTLFFAGHETTAHALTWAWYLLARNPHVVDKLRAEVERVAGDGPVSVAHLREMPYVEQVFKESMRILPSVWVYMKEPVEDLVVRGHLIKKGTPVMMSSWVMHHDARWFPSPETFDPDRFSPEREKLIPKGAFIPFSGGSRICLGKAFAMLEAKLILAALAQRVEFAVPDDYQPVIKAELSMHPDGGMPGIVIKREKQKLAAIG